MVEVSTTNSRPIVDPREGDLEDDASSSERHTILSLAGSLLAEISVFKLLVAWLLLIVAPALILGITPIMVSIWLLKVSDNALSLSAGIGPALLLVGLAALAWFGGFRLIRFVEQSFWSLNSLAIQPCYAACREILRHLLVRSVSSVNAGHRGLTVYAATALASGILICAAALLMLWLVWPYTLFETNLGILASPRLLVFAALANSVAVMSVYVAGAALVWSLADATIDPPHDNTELAQSAEDGRVWRVAHLSDIHVVASRYGFRIESGRAGPRGNERLRHTLKLLEAIHSENPLHAVLVTGDMTDAGLSTEWSEFLDLLETYPTLKEIMLLVPGNHDLNIVDRANPARLDLPTSRNKRLRKLRTLSAIDAIQGTRVRLIDQSGRRLGESLRTTLAPHLTSLSAFADNGVPRLMSELFDLWANAFPMVLPPDDRTGLGIILLNSNADTHFSFTNALGMMTSDQMRGIEIAYEQYPDACWIIALHHHVVEYPHGAKAASERIGTALINGNWFVRRLRRIKGRAILMHGHRHIDWIGMCSDLSIVSAPSPVMGVTDDLPSYFYIHSISAPPQQGIRLLEPQRIAVPGHPKHARPPDQGGRAC